MHVSKLLIGLLVILSIQLQNRLVIAQQSGCTSSLGLSVGGYARILSEEALPGFGGDPYSPSEYLSSLRSQTWQIPFDYLQNRDLFISAGPFCFEGDNLWRVRIFETLDWGNIDAWIFESRNGLQLLEPSDNRDMIGTAYSPTRISLQSIQPELAVDPYAQISPRGGGGGIWDYASLYAPGETISIPQHFSSTDVINVTIYAPDGSLYSTEQLIPDQWGSIYARVPDELGLPTGTWHVTFSTSVETREIAFQMKAIEQTMWQRCEGTEHVLMFSGFAPNERFALVQTAVTGLLSESVSAVSEELRRWQLQVDANGSLIVEDADYFYTSDLYESEFSVETNDQSWQESLAFIRGQGSHLSTHDVGLVSCSPNGDSQGRDPSSMPPVVDELVSDSVRLSACVRGDVGDFGWYETLVSTSLYAEPNSNSQTIATLSEGEHLFVTNRQRCNTEQFWVTVWHGGSEKWLLAYNQDNRLVSGLDIGTFLHPSEAGIYGLN